MEILEVSGAVQLGKRSLGDRGYKIAQGSEAAASGDGIIFLILAHTVYKM
jgi:hypothetical protein